VFFQKTIKIAAQLHNQKVTNSWYRFFQFHLKQNTVRSCPPWMICMFLT